MKTRTSTKKTPIKISLTDKIHQKEQSGQPMEYHFDVEFPKRFFKDSWVHLADYMLMVQQVFCDIVDHHIGKLPGDNTFLIKDSSWQGFYPVKTMDMKSLPGKIIFSISKKRRREVIFLEYQYEINFIKNDNRVATCISHGKAISTRQTESRAM